MSVQIIAHRGWWTKPEEQNTLAAFKRAWDAGIGVELDVRDYMGNLVVEHDPPVDEFVTPLLFQDVLDELGDRPDILAVNVKSCGLAPWFAKLKAPKNWFFFDVAPGDDDSYRACKLPLYKRENWQQGDPILLISSEIFGLDHQKFWQDLTYAKGVCDVFLITDHPAEALEFFK